MTNTSSPAVGYDAAKRAFAEIQRPLELQIAPLGHRAIAALAPRAGERMLDIGCGAGQTIVELAEAVGPGGAVTGIDVAAPMLEIAAERAAGLDGVSFILGDAQTWPFAPGSFDAAFSRIGVMFFADPVAAFANIRASLKGGGRLAFVCWRTLEENDVDAIPLRAALPYLPPQEAPTPDAPGPFAFADGARVRRVLAEAGFDDIEVAAYDEIVASGDLEGTTELSLRTGPLGRILRARPELRDVVAAPVRAALAAHLGLGGVRLNTATWIVTARAPD